MKKRINKEEWAYIGKRNYARSALQNLCVYTLEETASGFMRVQKLNIFIYALLFFPVSIAQLFYNLWDGGLKEFTFPPRTCGYDILHSWDEPGKRAKEIWERA